MQTLRTLAFLPLAAAAMAAPRADTLHFLNQEVARDYRLAEHEFGFARRNIAHGYRVLHQVLEGAYPPAANAPADPHQAGDKEHRDGEDVVAVLWALFDAAVQKNQGYDQGSFVVEDPQGLLHGFLKQNNRAGTRLSSHLKEVSWATWTWHSGIDLLGSYGAGDNFWRPGSAVHPHYGQQPVLPTKKGTILFFPLPAEGPAAAGSPRTTALDTHHVFIKMEDHGLGTVHDALNHLKDYVGKTLLGWGPGPLDPTEEAEKIQFLALPEPESQLEDSETKAHAFEWVDYKQPLPARKERPNPELVKLYHAFVNCVPNRCHGHFTSDTRSAGKVGLRLMRAEVGRLLAKVTGLDEAEAQRLNAHAEAFNEAVARKGYDNLDSRTFDEVVFSMAELRQAIASGLEAHPEVPERNAKAPAREPEGGMLASLTSWLGW